ncbi:MAG TPA: ADOP family duplicated permease [Vicinamibacterales bacterium]|nr:ADOP family duplicated permease [Vicinamibacterales bacterium]
MSRAKSAQDDLEDAIRDHIDRETEDNIDRGMAPEEARRQAMLRFGNVALVREDTRAVWVWPRLEQLVQDVRYAARVLLRRPTYALLSVLTLALGVGGAAAVYGIVRGVLLDPLPFAHEREVGVFWKKTDWTHEEYLFIRGRVPGFREVALYRHRDVILREGEGAARLVPGATASAELFDVLGVTPSLGRGFRAGDDVPGAEAVAVLSFGLWQEMGGTPTVIGTRVTLDSTPRTVVGVMPRGFWFPDPSVRVWTPEPLTPQSRSWNSTVVGRVAPNHDVGVMEAPIAQLTAMLDERFDYPTQWDKTINPYITPLRDDVLGPMRPALLATLGAMALILLIGCANVAALVLGQVDARSTEFALRSALGAKRQRLAQQLIIEVMLVATIAGAIGAAIAWTGFTVVIDALPLGAWAGSTAPDWRVFMSALAIAWAAAVLVILVPIISLCRSDLRAVLNRVRASGVGGPGGRLENSLVIAQVAFAVLIATGATLLARSVANLYAVEPGVRVEGVAVVDVIFGSGGRARREQTLNELTGALRGLAGVQSAGVVQKLLLRGGGYNLPINVNDGADLEGMTTEYRIVTPGYLESVGIALRQGRIIADADRAAAERVVVINEALARKYFAGVDPLGELIGGDVESPSRPARVVGVVGNAVEKRLTDDVQPVRYVALAQLPWMDTAQTFVLRAEPGVDAASLLESARRTIARVAPSVAVQQTTTMQRVLDAAIGPVRQVVLLFSIVTTLALILGAVGVYGVIAQFARRRRRDWAIRVALGCPGTRVCSYVLGHGALLVTTGIAVGIVAAALLTRLLSSFLYGVSAIDPLAFAAAGAALLGVGTVASLVPAWRAGTADPLVALREQ